jgi:hypothetical protein
VQRSNRSSSRRPHTSPRLHFHHLQRDLSQVGHGARDACTCNSFVPWPTCHQSTAGGETGQHRPIITHHLLLDAAQQQGSDTCAGSLDQPNAALLCPLTFAGYAARQAGETQGVSTRTKHQ